MSGWSRLDLLRGAVTWVILGVLLGALLVVLSVAGTTSMVRTATNFLLLVGLVVGVQVFVGNSGIVSFGHVAFAGIGAYLTAILTIPVDIRETALPDLPGLLATASPGPVVAILIAAVAAAVVALILGGALTRMDEAAMAMATLAVLVMGHTVFANWETVTRGTIGLYGVPRSIGQIGALAGVLCVIASALAFAASPTGRKLRAVRDDPTAGATLGINTARVRLGGWVVSAFLTGLAGGLWSQYNLAFGPDQFYYVDMFTLLSMLVIGGLGSVAGAVVGAAVVTLVSELGRELEAGLRLGGIALRELPGAGQLAIAVVTLALLILRPTGLTRGREAADWFARRRIERSGQVR
jgi:branched-chain amino acid transport system permease protein